MRTIYIIRKTSMDTIGIWPWKENNGPSAVAFPGQTGAREFSYEKRVPVGSPSLSLFVHFRRHLPWNRWGIFKVGCRSARLAEWGVARCGEVGSREGRTVVRSDSLLLHPPLWVGAVDPIRSETWTTLRLQRVCYRFSSPDWKIQSPARESFALWWPVTSRIARYAIRTAPVSNGIVTFHIAAFRSRTGNDSSRLLSKFSHDAIHSRYTTLRSADNNYRSLHVFHAIRGSRFVSMQEKDRLYL